MKEKAYKQRKVQSLDNQPGKAWVQLTREVYEDLKDRNRLLSNIALSAIALKMNIEHGLTPTLDALNRDLDAFHRRFRTGNADQSGQAN